MKKYIALALVLFAVASCYKDDSTDASQEIPVIVIVDDSDDILQWRFLEEVTFAPRMTYSGIREALLVDEEGLELTEEQYAQYDYLWRISMTTNADTARRTIGTERVLEYVVGQRPVANDYYNLALYMTNKNTGMQHSFYWDVMVSAEMGEGLLLAETNDDGLTSDLALIVDKPWSSYYVGENPKIFKGILRGANAGETAEGAISSIAFVARAQGYPDIATVVKGQSLFSIDPVSYEIRGRDGELFSQGLPSPWNPQFVYSGLPAQSYGYMTLINEGMPHYWWAGDKSAVYSGASVRSESYYITEDVVVPISVSSNIYALYFDKLGGKIVALDAQSNLTAAAGTNDLTLEYQDGLFDHRALSAFDCLYAGLWLRDDVKIDLGNNTFMNYDTWESIWLLQTKGTTDCYIYRLRTGAIVTGEDSAEYFVRGLQTFDMSGCTDFANATCYTNAMNVNGWTRTGFPNNLAVNEFYYAVDNKVYCVQLAPGEGTNMPTESNVRFTVPAAETITHMDFHKRPNGQVTWDDGSYGSANNLLTIVTYNEGTGEGKVYAVPRKHAGTGEMAAATPTGEDVKVYGGFGRITAICPRE